MCTSCHGLNVVTGQRMTKKAWAAQVDDMVSRGAIGSTEDIRQVVDYLAANFGKGAASQRASTSCRAAERAGHLATILRKRGTLDRGR